MKQYLIDNLETLGYPVRMQGTMPEDEAYPESFITFLTADSTEVILDDDAVAVAWLYNVAFYSSNPALVDTEPKRIYSTLKAAGFTPQGRGRDLPSDEPSHTGWVQEYYFIETL